MPLKGKGSRPKGTAMTAYVIPATNRTHTVLPEKATPQLNHKKRKK